MSSQSQVSPRVSERPALEWQVFISPAVPVTTTDLPPGYSRRGWAPTSSTLITGQRDAVLVDTFITEEEAIALGDWVETSGKTLRTIYITHGHGDHFFGLGALLERFPTARGIATPNVISVMRKQLEPAWLDNFWRARFPGQIAEKLVTAEPLQSGGFDLEGQRLEAIEVGHTDTDHTTVLHVPSLGLVVAGDVIYNRVHPYLSESDPAGRRQWLQAIEKVAALRPTAVVAGHKRPGMADDPRIIEETADYIRDFDRLAEKATDARQLWDLMKELHPNRMNPAALWNSCMAEFRRRPQRA
jgi:glyoxylase-like metal-dependent hydrolase (beta-lactamase superfamily II)